jgi:hypothetical protein
MKKQQKVVVIASEVDLDDTFDNIIDTLNDIKRENPGLTNLNLEVEAYDGYIETRMWGKRDETDAEKFTREADAAQREVNNRNHSLRQLEALKKELGIDQ